jgi:hypothetical protein
MHLVHEVYVLCIPKMFQTAIQPFYLFETIFSNYERLEYVLVGMPWEHLRIQAKRK